MNRRFLAAPCLALTLACDTTPPATPSASPPHAAPVAAELLLRFEDVTAASGVAFQHNTGAFGQRWLPETMGSGVLIFDANADHRPDLLFINGTRFAGKPGRATPPALYLNQGGLRFALAGPEMGLSFDAYCLGGAAGDLDNDGDPDLVLTCLGRDRLLINEGGRFTDRSAASGLSSAEEFGTAALLFDADRDGLLDLYVTRYVSWSPATDLFCSLDGKTKSYCTPLTYRGASPRFYRNRGNGTFEERTAAAGLAAPEAKALGAVSLDLNGDAWPDLAVAADTTPNLLYQNRGDGTFEEIGVAAGIAFSDSGRPKGGMGIDAGDFERNGREGLAISYFAHEMVGLYRNLGEALFIDHAPATELGRATLLTLGWGCFFFDYDLDGWLDFFVANGHLDEQIEKVQTEVKFAQPQQLFRGLGEGRFVDVAAGAAGDLTRPLVARGAAYADLDGDGDLDLVLTTNGGPAKIFENRGGEAHAWLRLHLRGTRSNRDGLGARVELTSAGATQSWTLRAGGSYLSQSQIDPTFGLGQANRAERITIRWPSGAEQVLTDVAARQVVEVVEPAN